MQHPDNRLVGVIDKPRLYLVGVWVDNKNGTIDEEDMNNVKEWSGISDIDVQFPGNYCKSGLL